MTDKATLAAHLAAELSNLITDPGDEVGLFESLCEATRLALPADQAWHAIGIRLHPLSSSNPVGWRRQRVWQLLPEHLRTEWLTWPEAYARLVARNPRLELADLMSDLSESHTFSSWPWDWEDLIEDWVIAGDPAAPLIDNRRDIDLNAIHARLCQLRDAVSGGWVWWLHDTRRVIYGDQAAWAAQRLIYAAQREELEAQLAQVAKWREQWKVAVAPERTDDAGARHQRSRAEYHPMQNFHKTRKS